MSRRDVLGKVKWPPAHTMHRGLLLDKYLPSSHKDDTESKRDLVRRVAESGEPQGYAEFFARYRRALEAMRAEFRQAETRGRLVVGLGGEGVLETSITLHRTYGVPYIPGSALKGLASRYAHLYLEGEAWRRNLAEFQRGEAQATLFGTTLEQGLIVFFDALPLPGKWQLHPDILNPHHQGYNAGGEAPPADWDSPVPVPFLSTTGTFLLALAPAPGVSLEEARPWLEAAWTILGWALREEGIGAKTSSGYGRMALHGAASPDSSDPEPVQVRARPELEELVTWVRSLSYPRFMGFLASKAQVILSLSPEELAEFKKALEAKDFLKDPRYLRQEAKGKLEVQEVLKKLGL